MSILKFENSRISARLGGGFSVLVVFTMLMGGIAMLGLWSLSDVLKNVILHPLVVVDTAQQAKSRFLSLDRTMKAALLAPTADEAEAEAAHIDALEREVLADMEIVRNQYLGPQQDVAAVFAAMEDWGRSRAHILTLLRQGRHAEAVTLGRGEAGAITTRAVTALDVIANYARAKVKFFSDLAAQRQSEIELFLAAAAVVLMLTGVIIAKIVTRSITNPLDRLRQTMEQLAEGDLSSEVPFRDGRSELAAMAGAVQVFKESAVKLEGQRWIKSNIAALGSALQTAGTARDFANTAITRLMPLLGGGAGVVYLWNEKTETLDLQGSWGFKKRRHLSTSYRLGESLVGQCALERATIILTEVPDDYIRIASGTGEAAPRTILVAPVVSRERVLGVIEIASFQPFTADQQALIEEALPVIGLNLEIQDRNHRTRELLEQTQQQAEELRATEEELRVQGEGLQAANLELQDKTGALERQARDLEASRAEADARALERDTASRYKSEFLANMSHELRTPLNSLLILARSLAENDERNLTDDQVDSARIISESGTHLLRLINDILDLSKVEAGKMVIDARDMAASDLAQSLSRRFSRLAEAKNLQLTVTVEHGLPPVIRADTGKLDQILNNLVGNALKFTQSGSVRVTIGQLRDGSSGGSLVIAVTDTGIGIPADKLERIFVAFEQVDGSTSRSFGGTGLGLTISRKLAQFLGGDIRVESNAGQGSVFTLKLPLEIGSAAAVAAPVPNAAVPPPPPMPAFVASAPALHGDDDRDKLLPRDEVILIVEDDAAFSRIVRDSARKRGFKCLLAADGASAVDLARRYRPTGIILDIGLPGMDGWTVMENLKKHPETRHIPVHFMSATDASRRGLEMGAVGYFTKPVTKEQIAQAFERIHHFAGPGNRRLLLVEDDPGTRKAVTGLLAGDNLEIVECGSGEETLLRLREDKPFDCMILDLGLPGMDGHALLKRCTEENLRVPPVVVYSARDLSEADTVALREYTDSIVIKGARSPERLIDEVTLFLHSVQARLSEAQQRALAGIQSASNGHAEHVVMVVDDDMRNTFALSKVLRAKGFRVLMAQDGRMAISQLEETERVDLILMDIMMPGMDGYEATAEIRKRERFRTLPIIALTAKAMVGDREKCLAAGADDYVSKPVDIDVLLAAMDRLLVR